MVNFSHQQIQRPIKITQLSLSILHSEETEEKYMLGMEFHKDIKEEKKTNIQNLLLSSPAPPEHSAHLITEETKIFMIFQ